MKGRLIQMNNKKNAKVIDIIIIIALVIVWAIIVKNYIEKSRHIGEKINKTPETSSQIEQNKPLVNEPEEENTVEEKYVQRLNNGAKLNDSKKLNENKKFEELELSDIQLSYNNGVTDLLFNVTNNSDKEFKMQKVNVILKDEQGNKVNEIPGIIEDIKPGETKQFHTAVSADYTNAYDFEIVKR